jgi:hypothetical protein
MFKAHPLIQTSTVFPFKNGDNGNNGILKGTGVMPGHFNPSAGDNMFSMNRYAYTRTANTRTANTRTANTRTANTRTANTRTANTRTANIQITKKPIYIGDSSSATMMKRINAIGKSSINTNGGKLAFSSQDKNTVNSILGRTRRSGCAAPAKKGYYPK